MDAVSAFGLEGVQNCLDNYADPKPNIEVSIFSFRKYNPTWEKNPLTEVYRIIATAK